MVIPTPSHIVSIGALVQKIGMIQFHSKENIHPWNTKSKNNANMNTKTPKTIVYIFSMYIMFNLN